MRLAKEIIAWLHTRPAADAAEAEWDRIQKGEGIPADAPVISVGVGAHKLAPILVKAGLAASNGEAIRKIKEGAVSLDEQRVTDFQKEYTFEQATVVRLGRKFARLVP